MTAKRISSQPRRNVVEVDQYGYFQEMQEKYVIRSCLWVIARPEDAFVELLNKASGLLGLIFE